MKTDAGGVAGCGSLAGDGGAAVDGGVAGRNFQDGDPRWTAVMARDPSADGRFVYAVNSTGVYCRPTCPSRRPRHDRVAFFDTPAQAEAAGYRPCRRCRPGDEVGPADALRGKLEVARRLLESPNETPTLEQLGQAVGLSPGYLQRTFRRETGLTPKEYAAAAGARRLKGELRRGQTVTSALYEAGYGSARAVYDQARQGLGMSPGSYRRGGEGAVIRYGFAGTPMGLVLLAATASGICALRLGDSGDEGRLLGELRAEFPRATLVEHPAPASAATADATDAPAAGEAFKAYLSAVAAYLSGRRGPLDLPLDVTSPTSYRREVWSALQAIPYGQTRTYAEVARSIGRPGAARAVGQACAANPVALVVPCHRVVRDDGGLGGYRWGIERKRRLLEQEAR